MDYQNRSFIFFIYRSLSFFLYLAVILSIGLVGTVGAMEDTDPGLYLPTTLLHNLERPSPPPQNVQAQIQTQL